MAASKRLMTALRKTIVDNITTEAEIKVQEARDEVGKYLAALAKKRIPKEVLEVYALYPGYIKATHTTYGHNSKIVPSYYTPMFENIPSCTGYLGDTDFGVLTKTETKQLDKHKACLKKAEGELTDLQAMANKVVGTCNTVKQLIKAWPEAEKFMPEESKESTGALKIVPDIEALNVMLGIKPVKK